jgi:N-acetylmuramoyl-L-alanine amidase
MKVPRPAVGWLRLCTVLIGLLLAGCATTTPGGVPIDTRFTARGQDSRVLFLILHYTAGSLPVSLEALTGDEVSVHYLLSDEEPPVIYRLVDENRRAWHAGVSSWKGHAMLNANSIGIEIVHPGFRDMAQGREYLPYPKGQIDALIPLLKDVVRRHGIRPDRILGHSEVQPQTKDDPGPTFPWQRLAAEGLIPWPDAARVATMRSIFDTVLPGADWFQQELARYGYAVPRTGVLDEATRRVLSVFQMRYRPAHHDGLPDAETAALLRVLNNPP